MLKIWLIGCLIVFAAAFVAASEEKTPPRILFIGNSITRHGPAPGTGWDGDEWGMAASTKDKDYVHLLLSRLTEAAGVKPEAKITNAADFERQHATYDTAKHLKAELDFQADIVVVAIGENVPALANEAAKAKFGAALDQLLANLSHAGKAKLIVRSCFWPDATKDAILRQSAETAGATFIDIGKLGGDEANAARSERKFTHDGVAGHPGDKGMQAIADALWPAVKHAAVR